MELSRPLPPDIRSHTDYRKFLRESYLFKKSQRVGFSFRAFAQKSGFKSPNYLQLVMQGKRSLNEATAKKVAQALGLKSAEREYFVALVRQAHAHTEAERAEAQKAILVAVRKHVSRDIPHAQSEVITHWYHLVIRELVFLPDFEANGKWIAKRLKNLVSAEQADESLTLLLKGGFLDRLPSGQLAVREPAIDTGDGFGQLRVRYAHSETLALWRKLLEQSKDEDLELGLLNIPISSSKMPEFKKRLRAFQDEIIGWVLQEEKPDRIVQLGTYLFSVSTAKIDS